MDKQQLQQLYLRAEYYWGKEPNRLATRFPDLVPENERSGKKLVDLGAGEGRDSVFLAEQGFAVLAVDIAPAGLDKARRLADERNVRIETLEADVNDLILPELVDVLYSIGTLQYIEPQNRQRQFRHFKQRTAPGGLHVLFAFVEHPDVQPAPDWGQNEYLYARDELQSYYRDWETVDTYEFIFDCNSSHIPHRHAARVLIARKPAR
ncbi:methyltransferase domain-containing protein [Effusibacillus pohliae]|uniref:methyltransferase domain-containing protein n=1 Tax=Effusibacillus pohliae TaxID=232270 RepID=UPI0003819FBF|nr:methyltransferase domain-containing protein [Effusibacillus pohliae]